MTPEELEAIRQRCEAASRLIAGKVVVRADDLGLRTIWGEREHGVFDGKPISMLLDRTCLAPGSADRAEFYAACYTDVPALLELVSSQAAELEGLKGSIDWFEWYFKRQGYHGESLLSDWLNLQFAKRDIYNREHSEQPTISQNATGRIERAERSHG